MKLRLPELSNRRQVNWAWAAVAAVLAVAVALGARTEFEHRRQVAQQVRVQADILAASVTAALAFDDRDAMREYVNALRANPRADAAAVYDIAGRALVTYARGGVAPPDQVGPVGVRYRAGAVTVVTPVSERGTQLGYVHLATSPEPLSRLLVRHSGLALVTVLALGLLGMITRAASLLQGRADELAEANQRLVGEMAEREKAEEALLQSQKMEALGQLTGGIAHDFNNLLQVVQGAFELIRRKPGEADKVGAWAENGLKATERGASLTRQLLAFSRSQKLELKPFHVSDLVADMRELLERTLGPTIELSLELDDQGVPVLSDRTQLELAVLNLAINARDAMPEGGRLTITAQRRMVKPGHPVLAPDDYVELCVSDTGVGMSGEVAQRAFDPFFTTKSLGKGTGLGLSQVYGVARQAGGAASIESEPGVGTTIKLLLRRSARAPAAEAPHNRAGSAPQAGAATVLVVDDDPQVRTMVRDALEMHDFQVLEAESGPQALETLSTTRPDVLLLDFAMPGMNGAEVAVEVRKRWRKLPIVFASGHADTQAVEAALGGQATTLRKPFDMDQLTATLADAARRG